MVDNTNSGDCMCELRCVRKLSRHGAEVGLSAALRAVCDMLRSMPATRADGLMLTGAIVPIDYGYLVLVLRSWFQIYHYLSPASYAQS